MTKAAATIFYFGIYVVILGLLFIIMPEQLVLLAKLPPLAAGWARIVGLLALIVGTCDIISGKHNVTVIVRASVYIRLAFAASIALLVIVGQMPFTTIFFGVPDAIGAFWTALQLKAEAPKQ